MWSNLWSPISRLSIRSGSEKKSEHRFASRTSHARLGAVKASLEPTEPMSVLGACRKWLGVRLKFAMRHITDFGNSTQPMSARPSYSADVVVSSSPRFLTSSNIIAGSLVRPSCAITGRSPSISGQVPLPATLVGGVFQVPIFWRIRNHGTADARIVVPRRSARFGFRNFAIPPIPEEEARRVRAASSSNGGN